MGLVEGDVHLSKRTRIRAVVQNVEGPNVRIAYASLEIDAENEDALACLRAFRAVFDPSPRAALPAPSVPQSDDSGTARR